MKLEREDRDDTNNIPPSVGNMLSFPPPSAKTHRSWSEKQQSNIFLEMGGEVEGHSEFRRIEAKPPSSMCWDGAVIPLDPRYVIRGRIFFF